MQTLTFNNKQLLFVRVHIEACGYSKLTDNDAGYELLGAIQKENGMVSTTIPDEVLERLVKGSVHTGLLATETTYYYLIFTEFISQMESQGLTLRDGEKYVVLEIK